jgi:hypothetical protein
LYRYNTALTELDSALAVVRDSHREKEALEEALNDAEDVAGQKTSVGLHLSRSLAVSSQNNNRQLVLSIQTI